MYLTTKNVHVHFGILQMQMVCSRGRVKHVDDGRHPYLLVIVNLLRKHAHVQTFPHL